MGAAASTAGPELPAPPAQEQEVQVCTGPTDLSAYVKHAIEGLKMTPKSRSCAVPCLAHQSGSQSNTDICIGKADIDMCCDLNNN